MAKSIPKERVMPPPIRSQMKLRGMSVKASVAAITAGVEKVSLVDGRVAHSVVMEIFTDAGVGTEVVL